MSQPTEASSERIGSSSIENAKPNHDHAHDHAGCSQCRVLEQRIAELLAASTNEGKEERTAGPGSSTTVPDVEFKALRLIPYSWGEGWHLRPAPARRHWMDQLPHAYKCLPLVVANQWGWQLLCPTDVVATWDGTAELAGLRVEVPPQYEPAIKSQFGAGIITFSPPWLFRTPPGWDLFLKGPTNRWKTNCVPLEGIIETWWLNYTFTLNWKIVEPGTVVFRQGESLGQLVPVPHLTFQGASATEAPIGLLEPEAAKQLLEWQETRRRIAGQRDNVHHLYRKAEGIDEHFQRVTVPSFRIIDADEALRLKLLAEEDKAKANEPQ